MTEAELARLHALAMDRRYDLRVCNPAHAPFYTFMSRYKDGADDAPALRALANEIDAYRQQTAITTEMRAAYEQLAALARWQAGRLLASSAA